MIKNRLDRQDVTVLEDHMDGISLLELVTGYDKAIIIDAIQTGREKSGHIYRIDPAALNAEHYSGTPHGLDLITALRLGKKLDYDIPPQIIIFAIEAADVTTLSEDCTLDVKKAIPICVEMILQELNESP